MVVVMNQQQHKLIYHVHRTMGSFVALVLFAICLSGTLTVLRSDIEAWSLSPLVQATEKSFPFSQPHRGTTIDDAIATFAEHHSLDQSTPWAIFLPTDQVGTYKLLIHEADPQSKSRRLIHAYLHAKTGKYLGVPGREIGDFIFQFHANFTLKTKLGRYVVGLFGFSFLLLIATGLFLHRHLLRDLFKFRWTGSDRRLFSDTHKLVGTWFLLFHILIASTGTIIALKDLLLVVPAFATYRGDLARARRELSPAPPQVTGQASKMQNVQTMIETARSNIDNFSPTLVTIYAWNDRAAEVSISGSLPNELLPKNEAANLNFSGASGQILARAEGRNGGIWQRSFAALTPLHYGDFFGLTIKIAYLIGGVSTIVLIWSGLLIWLNRASKRRAQSGAPTC